ncbi:liver carboxylesterase 2-like isoform X2 [Thrips palmi]|uniref:Carboxylic ester hydrolase n=1 Tax=Thrips palmi TaxID=161013 RepID=A0A6P8ZW11_THRPL|nr:liver carboxylesterase 2-like isoform X2 [Thrips palmi]
MGTRLMWATVVVVAALFFGASQTADDECTGPTVSTRLGQVCGRTAVSKTSVTYQSFQGIPYAKPPVGDLRFKDPQPAEPWTGVLRALHPGAQCLQSGQGGVVESLSPTLRQALLLVRALPSFLSMLTSGNRQSEDCLFLNVYTRQVQPASPRPVMVWIHGGGFHLGNGGPGLYGPDYLMDTEDGDDVVLVTMNYRLGPLGFLSVPDGGAPGNAGLKDQNAALRWVRDNIAAFGGNPNRVTIFGESAGGTSVQMHLLSPMSRGLFHGAISQSGSAFNPRSSTTEGRENAYRLARLVGIDSVDDAELVKRLQQVPAHVLAAKSESVLTAEERSRGLAVHPFVPSPEATTSAAFLPGMPHELLARGDIAKVPYIVGINSLEAGFMLNRPRDFSVLQLDKETENLVPSDLGLQFGSPEHQEVAARMRREYFGDNVMPSDEQLAQFYSDLFVSWVVHRTVNVFSRADSPALYVYHFSHDGGLSFSQRLLDKKLPGVIHGDELGYLFTQDLLPSGRESELDTLVRRRMVKLWTNFAKTGTPNGGHSALLNTEWLPANNQSGLYLDIGADLAMKQGSLSPHMGFWDSLYTTRQGGRRPEAGV